VILKIFNASAAAVALRCRRRQDGGGGGGRRRQEEEEEEAGGSGCWVLHGACIVHHDASVDAVLMSTYSNPPRSVSPPRCFFPHASTYFSHAV
jgi:hypothetical protein